MNWIHTVTFFRCSPLTTTLLVGLPDLEDLLRQYGYVAVFFGAILEGETALLPAAFAAHRGYLLLAGVVGSAFLGSSLAAYGHFWLGRWIGQRWLSQRPRLQQQSARIQRLIDRHPTGLLLGYHFLYGFRTLIPLVYGISRFSPVRFAVLATCSTLIWAITVGLLGYSCGQFAQQILGSIKAHERTILLVLVLLALAYGLLVRYEVLARLRARFSPKNQPRTQDG